MKQRVGDAEVNYVEHGEGTPVLVLHGAGVDHHEAEACFEPAFVASPDYRRIYPDLPGMGLTSAPASVPSADDVLEILLGFARLVVGDEPLLVVGHSAGAYYGQAMAARLSTRVTGLALVCPLLASVRSVPEHRVVAGSGELGDETFRSYFVVQTPEMLDRYERYVAPAADLVDDAALERIGERWEITGTGNPFTRPMLIVAGRLDSVVGFEAAHELADASPRASLAVLDDAGHALPHEQPALLRALIEDWLHRVSRHEQARVGG